MRKIHINPETGKPGTCSATIQCEFAINGQEPEHYTTIAEAQTAYEKTQAQNVLKTVTQKPRKIKKTLRNMVLFGGALLTTVSLSACNMDDFIDISSPTSDGGGETTASSGYETQGSQTQENPTVSQVDPNAVLFQGKTLQPSQEEISEAKTNVSNMTTRVNDENADYDRAGMYGRSFKTGVVGRLEHRDIPLATFKNDAPQARAIGGTFIDPYTGETVEVIKGSSQDTNVDHILPLKAVSERNDPNNPMPEDIRKEIANDPDNLQVVGASVNKSKSDSTIDEYMPSYQPAQCRYAISTINVYVKYGDYIAPNQAEKDTMQEIVNTRCDDVQAIG